MDSIVESQSNLKTLTEGIHSKEALDLVREHVLGVMGSAGMAYSNTMLKMSTLQVRVKRLNKCSSDTGQSAVSLLMYDALVLECINVAEAEVSTLL